VFQVSEPMKIGTLSVSISPKGELDLIRVPHFFPGAMQAIFPNSDGYEIVSKKEITLDCGTDAVEFEMDWLWEDGHTSFSNKNKFYYPKITDLSLSAKTPFCDLSIRYQ
jgi:hypothetical protein